MFSFFEKRKEKARKKGERSFVWNGKIYPAFTREELLYMQDEQRVELQSKVDSMLVSRMILEFHGEFRELYSDQVIPGCGPMQTFLGLAVEKGYITINKE